MGRNLYVGNLPWSATSKDVQELFSVAGTCKSARVLCDRHTGHSRGFGFVEIASETEAAVAIRRFNGYEFRGRALRVMEARDGRDKRTRGAEMPIGSSWHRARGSAFGKTDRDAWSSRMRRDRGTSQAPT
jgi:cold-inducible RNA-binding protein